MAKQKIAILGGGISGLSAAYQLSRTPALQARFDITVYQMGWRLGGKIASGRDASGRNLEHGLHVWFGCYDNAFRMLQEVYSSQPQNATFKAWTDALKPQPFTPIGVETDGDWSYWPITWPSNAEVPGQGGLQLTLWEMITRLVAMLRQTLTGLGLDFPVTTALPEAHGLLQGIFGLAARFGLPVGSPGRALADELAAAGAHSFLDVLKATQLWAEALGADPTRHAPQHPDAIVDLLGLLNDAFKAGPAATAAPGTTVHVVRDMLDIAQAFIKGMIDDVLKPDQPFEALDAGGLEFRAWLVKHGADPGIVDESSIIRALYDTAFQYLDGDPAHPSYAAGTAVGVLTRLVATYKGDMLWEVQSGMGEAVIAPLYRRLLGAGVKFRFFHKVRKLELSADKKQIAKIHIDRQADVVAGDYRPTFNVGGLECWGSEPDWTQLVNGAQLKAAGANFESHWNTTAATAQIALQQGADYDSVVLAISMGAYKPLNAEAGMCDELIAASSAFDQFVNKIPIVPTLSLQLWCDVTTAVLGWDMGKPAAVAGPEPLSVWADMSQVLDFEPWQNVATKPKSLHYLCGTFATPLFKQPSTNATVPAQAAAALKQAVVDWLEHSSNAAWDVACDGKSFRWEMLIDPAGRAGNNRLDAQYLRANIGPTDCCVGSPAGTTQFRLGPDPGDHGFANLFLAGEAARSGCNTSAVEGAVMTGMAAARAISGDPIEIVGYDFLTTRPSEFIQE